MKVVLDTNVLVSGLLSPFQAPGQIVRMISAGILRICYDARTLSEYRSVLLRPKFHFDHKLIDALMDQVEARGHKVASEPLPKPFPHSADEPFLEVAVASSTSCLVTGNLKHFPTSFRFGVKVFSPTDFLEFYRHHGK